MSGPGAMVSSAEAMRKSPISGINKKAPYEYGAFLPKRKSRQACAGSIETVRFFAGPRVWYFTRPVAVAKSV